MQNMPSHMTGPSLSQLQSIAPQGLSVHAVRGDLGVMLEDKYDGERDAEA